MVAKALNMIYPLYMYSRSTAKMSGHWGLEKKSPSKLPTGLGVKSNPKVILQQKGVFF